MAPELRTPGVYREEAFVRAPEALPTGVPGFVGLGSTVAPDAKGDLVVTGEPQELLHVDQLSERWVPPSSPWKSYLAAVVEGFFANGGTRCFIVGAGTPVATEEKDGGAARLTAAIDRLGRLDVDLVAVPDAMVVAKGIGVLPPEAGGGFAVQVLQALLDHCMKEGNRFAILDGLFLDQTVSDPVARIQSWRDDVVKGLLRPEDAAMYFPWIWPVGASESVPPCGHVAGIFARSDQRLGVYKAPANEALEGVVNLDFLFDASGYGDLNQGRVNALRALPGRGIRVMGARTLSKDPAWVYVNVRRIFITLTRWIDRNMGWATFEPSGTRLWNRISREVSGYLRDLWRAGGLQGASQAEAFFVKCDAETNPQEVRDQGQVVTEIGLAPAAPAEFVVVRVTQRAGSTQIS